MSKRRAIVEFENALMLFMSEIMDEKDRRDGSFGSGNREIREHTERAREPLHDLGMYQELMTMLARAESLVREKRYDDAVALVYHTRHRLLRKSGTLERLTQRFVGRELNSLRESRLVGPLPALGPPEPDTYGGQFFERAAPGEIDAAVTAMWQVESLEGGFAKAAAGRDSDLGQRLDEAERFSMAAEVPLRKLGLYRMVVQTFDVVRSLCAERNYPAADRLVKQLFEYFQERLDGEKPPALRVH